MTTPLQRGDFVWLTIGEWRCKAMVTLASENGRSLIVLFDGAAPVGGGMMVGSMPLFREDAGTYIELMTRTPVDVAREH